MGKILVTGLFQNKFADMFLDERDKFNGMPIALRTESDNKFDPNAVVCFHGVDIVGRVIIEQSKDVTYLINSYGFKKEMILGSCFNAYSHLSSDLIKDFKKPIIGVDINFQELIDRKQSAERFKRLMILESELNKRFDFIIKNCKY